MKTQEEVQRAHDLLEGIVLGEVPGLTISPDKLLALHASIDVLCWILGCQNETFTENLKGIEEQMKALGFLLCLGKPKHDLAESAPFKIPEGFESFICPRCGRSMAHAFGRGYLCTVCQGIDE